MKKRTLLSLAIAASLISHSAQANLEQAKRAFTNNHYDEAIVYAKEDIDRVSKGGQAKDQFFLGVLFYKASEFYQQLQLQTLAAQEKYLVELVARKGDQASTLAPFYLGEVLMQRGQTARATEVLKKATTNARLPEEARKLAALDLQYLEQLKKSKPAAVSITSKSPVLDLHATALNTKLGLAPPKTFSLGATPKGRELANSLQILIGQKDWVQALAVIEKADKGAPDTSETLNSGATLNFFDPSLTGNIATVYRELSVNFMERAAADSAVGDTAKYQLSEIGLTLGAVKVFEKYSPSLRGLSQLPAAVKPLADIRVGALDYLKGQQKKAVTDWEQKALEMKSNPTALAELLRVCLQVNADCNRVADQAAMVATAGRTPALRPLQQSLGNYYLQKGDAVKGLTALEVARDKAAKNKLEVNNPLLLMSLSEGYVSTKEYSESLEIYFEMNSQFPAVRQIQDALQGIYSMQQKSAGNVTVF